MPRTSSLIASVPARKEEDDIQKEGDVPSIEPLLSQIQDTRGPNWWWKYKYVVLVRCTREWHSLVVVFSRQMIREPAAEFFGVMILVIFGAGVDCQVVLSGNPGVASSQKGVCRVQPV